jgi:hypothetical protein
MGECRKGEGGRKVERKQSGDKEARGEGGSMLIFHLETQEAEVCFCTRALEKEEKYYMEFLETTKKWREEFSEKGIALSSGELEEGRARRSREQQAQGERGERKGRPRGR